MLGLLLSLKQANAEALSRSAIQADARRFVQWCYQQSPTRQRNPAPWISVELTRETLCYRSHRPGGDLRYGTRVSYRTKWMSSNEAELSWTVLFRPGLMMQSAPRPREEFNEAARF